jgi:hypothetical protein
MKMKIRKEFGGASALALLAALLLLSACETSPTATTPAEESNVTTEDVVNETDAQVGKEVTIRNTVDKTVDDTSFLLNDDQLFSGEGVLVVNTTSEPFVIPDVGTSQVQVTGIVETFTADTATQKYNLTLDPTLYEEYENQPVIFAKSIALSPDPGDITANPEEYYNERIAVHGDVQDTLQQGLFTISEDELFSGENLLVISPDPSAPIQPDATVVVTGVLRPYIQADFERDYDLQWDLSVQQNIEAEYQQEPVFVADGIYPSAVPE